jgi:predicted NodU family carbamoyl transferase
MIVLGTSESRTDAAAAVVVDGRLVAAAGEAELSGSGYGYARGRYPLSPTNDASSQGTAPELATRFGLAQARLRAGDVSTLAVVDETRWADDELREAGREVASSSALALSALSRGAATDAGGAATTSGLRVVSVAAGHAAAALAVATLPAGANARLLVVDGATDAGAIFRSRGGVLKLDRELRGAGHILTATQTMAEALGLRPDRGAIDALAELGAPDAHGATGASDDASALRRALQWDDGEIRFDAAVLRSYVEQTQARVPGSLAHADHPHLDVQRARRLVASSFIENLLALVSTIIRGVGARGADAGAAGRADAANGVAAASGQDAEAIAFGGSLFTSPRVNSQLAARLGGTVSFSPVPERIGLAPGAALAVSPRATDGAALAHVGLGPSFTEDEIKATLENCRIDFVYEPSWQRLLTRTSRLLARGKVIAWFQGPLDFGPRSLGSRGILCDPSNRYARHNVNEYLLGRPVDAPLAVSLLADAADDFLDEGLHSPFMLRRGQFREASAEQVRSALDSGRGCTVHTATPVQSTELRELLTVHRQETGVPGLIHQPLASGQGPMAATPRAALQAFYSSAIDAMVIGRFLLMKDYWLLRSDA